jgi:hypothetical protein
MLFHKKKWGEGNKKKEGNADGGSIWDKGIWNNVA